MRIYNLGSLNIDYVYDVDHFVSAGETLSSDKMQIFPGGKGLNQSVALARAGAEVIHGAVIGEDGGFLTEILSSAGVDTSRIETISRRCGHAAGEGCQCGRRESLPGPAAERQRMPFEQGGHGVGFAGNAY